MTPRKDEAESKDTPLKILGDLVEAAFPPSWCGGRKKEYSIPVWQIDKLVRRAKRYLSAKKAKKGRKC